MGSGSKQQQLLARTTLPQWSGDLNDDCTADWAGLTLRAEMMDNDQWWWCVYDNELEDSVSQVRSSNDAPRASSGEEARNNAEYAARKYLFG